MTTTATGAATVGDDVGVAATFGATVGDDVGSTDVAVGPIGIDEAGA